MGNKLKLFLWESVFIPDAGIEAICVLAHDRYEAHRVLALKYPAVAASYGMGATGEYQPPTMITKPEAFVVDNCGRFVTEEQTPHSTLSRLAVFVYRAKERLVGALGGGDENLREAAADVVETLGDELGYAQQRLRRPWEPPEDAMIGLVNALNKATRERDQARREQARLRSLLGDVARRCNALIVEDNSGGPYDGCAVVTTGGEPA